MAIQAIPNSDNPDSLPQKSIHSHIHTSAVASPITKHDVHTKLNYYKDPPDGSKPQPNIIGKPETYQPDVQPLNVTIHDIRGEEKLYNLDDQGFQLHKHPSAEKAFVDDTSIKSIYYPETEDLLKKVTGASRVQVFGHTLRRASAKGPVLRVHVDQSYNSAPKRLDRHLPPDDAGRLLQTRHQIINVWRPIKTIEKDPLAVCDARSCPDTDLVPVTLVFPDRVSEMYYVQPSTQHKWHYCSGMTPDEVMLIKCYDSKVDGRARRVPHSGFVDPSIVNSDQLAARESIETRCLVFYEDQPAE